MDSACRMLLRLASSTPVDANGKTVSDGAHALGRAVAQLQHISTTLVAYCLVMHVDPAQNKDYQQHRDLQDGLEARARRLQSSSTRYLASKAKQEKGQGNSGEAKYAEISCLKQELAETKGKSVPECKALYKEVVADGSGTGPWKTKGGGKQKPNKQQQQTPTTGGGKKGGGGGGKGGGRGKGGRRPGKAFGKSNTK